LTRAAATASAASVSSAHVVHVASGREWRGGQHQVLLLARALHQRGVRVAVVTGAGGELAHRLADADVPLHAVPWQLGLDPRVALALRRLVRAGTIVHAHDSHAHALATFVARRRDAPVIVTRRVTFPIRHPRRYRAAAAVIAISSAVRHEVIAAGCDPRRVHVVPSAIDPDDVAPAGERTEHAVPLVVCIAALAPEKGVDTLLAAAAELRDSHPELRWLVVGAGPEHAALTRMRSELRLESIVEFALGDTPADALRRATIAVQPSRAEGLGSAVLQAIALGVPVVASDAGGLPEALAHGGGVLVRREDASQLAAAVSRLLEHPAEREALGAAGRTAADHYSVDRMVERTLDVYRSVVPTLAIG